MKKFGIGPRVAICSIPSDDFKNIDAFKVHLVPTLADAASGAFHTRALPATKT
jgi:hypothetical protein